MNEIAKIKEPRQSVTEAMASRYGMTAPNFEATLRATVVPNNCSREQFAAFLLVAREYNLNPITKEIYAFPVKGGGIQPIVGIDGWMNLINSHPDMDGLEFDDHFDDTGEISSITARIWRKDRGHPIAITEYMSECRRQTEPWNKWPKRMLRHKAAIQCARYAFGFAGIIDPDEAERSPEVVTSTPVVNAPKAPPAPPAVEEDTIDAEIVEDEEDEKGTPKEEKAKPEPKAKKETTKVTLPEYPGTGDPEAFLKWCDTICATVTARKPPGDIAELETTWNVFVDQYVKDLLPPDQEEAIAVYQRHERKLEP